MFIMNYIKRNIRWLMPLNELELFDNLSGAAICNSIPLHAVNKGIRRYSQTPIFYVTFIRIQTSYLNFGNNFMEYSQFLYITIIYYRTKKECAMSFDSNNFLSTYELIFLLFFVYNLLICEKNNFY